MSNENTPGVCDCCGGQSDRLERVVDVEWSPGLWEALFGDEPPAAVRPNRAERRAQARRDRRGHRA